MVLLVTLRMVSMVTTDGTMKGGSQLRSVRPAVGGYSRLGTSAHLSRILVLDP